MAMNVAVNMAINMAIAPAALAQTPVQAGALHPVPPPIGANPALPNSDLPTRGMSEAYTLSRGDRINVVIANVPEYSGTYQVLVDGTVDLPVLGNVDVQRMTLAEASAAIAQQYARAEILVQPLVNVILAEANTVEITVTGEVNRPGAYAMTLSNGELPTLVEAIEQAGGITQQANLQQVQIRRPQRTGETRVMEVSLWKLLSEGDINQNITLRDGDMIALTPAPAMDIATAEVMGNANFSASTVQINLVGEVRQPGLLAVPPNTSLNEAVLMAGGFNNRARRGSVELLQMHPNGTVSRQRISINFSDDVNDATNPILRDRDVVIVGRSAFARVSDTLGTLLSPIGGAFSLFNLFSPFFAPSSSP
ncbi:MAG TPA: SLBB domain-containing protein [Chroococcidiopsis sp.]